MATNQGPERENSRPSGIGSPSASGSEVGRLLEKRMPRRRFVGGVVQALTALTVVGAVNQLAPNLARAQGEDAPDPGPQPGSADKPAPEANDPAAPVDAAAAPEGASAANAPTPEPDFSANALAVPADIDEQAETPVQVLSPSSSQMDRPQPFIPPERPERNPNFPNTSGNTYFRPGDQPEYSRFNDDVEFNKAYMFELYTTMTSLRNIQNPDDPINLFDKYGYELWSRSRGPITDLAKIYTFLYDKKFYREGTIQTPFYPVLGSDQEPGKIAVGPGVDMTLIRGLPARSTLSIGTFALTMCMVNNRAREFDSSGKRPADFSNYIKGNSIETAAAIGLALDTILPSLLELNSQADEFGIIRSEGMTRLVTEYHRASSNTSESERKMAKAQVIKERFGLDNPVADIAGRLR